MEDHHLCQDGSKTTIPGVPFSYMFLGTIAGQNSTEASLMVVILHTGLTEGRDRACDRNRRELS